MEIICHWCRQPSEKPDKEIRRQLKNGQTRFFCSSSCSAFFSNSLRPKINREIEKKCKFCENTFKTNIGRHEADFCSRSCASSGSVTDFRRERASYFGKIYGKINCRKDLFVSTLKSREAWKYQLMNELLIKTNINYEFEYQMSNYVFDLALLDKKIFIEFDSKYHQEKTQSKKDKIRDNFAKSKGWKVIRIKTLPSSVINPCLLVKALNDIKIETNC